MDQGLAICGSDIVLSVWPNHISDEVPPLYTQIHRRQGKYNVLWEGQSGVSLRSPDGWYLARVANIMFSVSGLTISVTKCLHCVH